MRDQRMHRVPRGLPHKQLRALALPANTRRGERLAAPHGAAYIYVTPVGKHRIAPGHKLNYELIDGKRYIRKLSTYKAKDFLEFSGKRHLPDHHDLHENGYIISRYLDGLEDAGQKFL